MTLRLMQMSTGMHMFPNFMTCMCQNADVKK